MPSHRPQPTTIEPEGLSTPENINDLARIIESEAGGRSDVEKAMVGWTVINRMRKNNLMHVSGIWANGSYAHGHFPNAGSLRMDETILEGTAMDISQGATHVYAPSAMPKAGEPHVGIDIGGGL